MSIDLSNQVIIITGANSGIGKVAAIELAKMNATVVMVCRSQERGSAALAEVKQASGNSRVHLMLCDLSSQQSIRDFVDAFQAEFDRLDVLLNNAGAIFGERKESVDGLEMTFATNHMGYFLLTELLLDMLKASAPSRIINVASDAHRVGKLTFDDLQRTSSYSSFRAYGESKLMNVMHGYVLARRLEGTGVTANSLHPGFVRTNFGRRSLGWIGRLFMPVVQLAAINEAKGAETMIYLAASPDVAGVSGRYFDKKKAVKSSDESYDEAAQQRLWEISEAAVV